MVHPLSIPHRVESRPPAAIYRAALIAVVALIAGCKGSGGSGGSATTAPDAPSQACDVGAKECRPDGLYTCDASQSFQLTEACTDCEATPVPHCAVACGEPGVTSICDGDSVKDCAAGTTRSCDPGTCVPSGTQAVCGTKAGMSACVGQRSDGTDYILPCADANGISTTQVCDQRTGQCVSATFDCSALTTVPADRVACDAASGNYYSSCIDGQPSALACSTGTSCANDGSTSCYTSSTPGMACGGPAVCFPGLHCTQQSATGASCVRPAGQLACNSTDVLAVCTNADTGFACVDGAIWRWNSLTAWGGSCTNDHITLPVGGVCIPGLADCKQGLECHRSRYDIAGVCEPPEPNAPAACTLTGQASIGLSCAYAWHDCRDGRYYDLSCAPVNVGGIVATLCDCSVNGTKIASFGSDTICGSTSTALLDSAAMQGCGWDVTTVDVARD